MNASVRPSFQIPPRKNLNRAKYSPAGAARPQRRQPSASRYQAGDTILFGKYSGQEIKLDGIEYPITKEDDVLGVQEGRR